jgi:hypothetical protein
MQRRRSQLSLNVGFVLADSALALTRGEEERGKVKPHTMGKTVLAPDRFGAMTGTILVGRTSPSVTIGLPSLLTIRSFKAERFASSIIGRSSGDISM